MTKANTPLKLLDGSGQLKKRKTRKIIRFRHYGKFQEPEDYAREQLMLFIPWRDENKELLSINSIEVAKMKEEEILKNSVPFYAIREIDDEALHDILHEIEDDVTQEEEEIGQDDSLQPEDDELQQDNFVEEIGTGRSRVQKFLIPKLVDEQEYLKIMRTLNEKQRRFVLNALHLFKSSECPYYQFLSGGAGVGKSHAITAMVQSFMRYDAKFANLNPDHVCVLVAAPTGKAAFNVFGMTLHCTFKLPPNQYGGRVHNLDDGAVNSLRLKLSRVKVFIIDEISMVSMKQLYDIDQRLRQIFSTTQDFGGKSFIVVGHLRQLPPVAATYVFTDPTHLPNGGLVGNHLWAKFNLFELTEIMRQKGELEFCKALNNMSEGCMDHQDIRLIKSREISRTNQPPECAIHLFPTNTECQEYNDQVHQKLNTDGALSIAFDKVQG